MKILAIIVLIFASVTVADSELEIVEVFRAETPEELEAALADGYPPPWLAEILEDETIPEEDRYWLDCRVRAVIAQELHEFYDSAGGQTHYEAEWIGHIEPYWRETFVVAPLDAEEVAYPVEPEGELRGTPGLLVDANGEQFGTTAMTIRGQLGARDGSVMASGYFRINGSYRLVLFYPDGSIHVSPIVMGYGRCAVSEYGNYVFLAANGYDVPWTDEDVPHRAILLDRSGEILWEEDLELRPHSSRPAISPDGRYCSIASYSLNRQLLLGLGAEQGRAFLRIEDSAGNRLSFSPNGSMLCASGHGGRVYDMESGQQVWEDSIPGWSDPRIGWMMYLDCTDDCSLLSALTKPSERGTDYSVTLFSGDGEVLLSDHLDGNMDISPGGRFLLTENYQPGFSSESPILPVIIRDISMEVE